jgi:hypothetical protein
MLLLVDGPGLLLIEKGEEEAGARGRRELRPVDVWKG